MLFIQMTGLSGAGKTTLAYAVQQALAVQHYTAEVIDADEYRQHLCRDLGFSSADRMENIRRLGRVGQQFAGKGIIAIMAAINPFQQIRDELRAPNSRLVWIDCPLPVVRQRDTKGLYRRADLPDNHPDKITMLTGYGDVFDMPQHYDLRICTATETIEQSTRRLFRFITVELAKQGNTVHP